MTTTDLDLMALLRAVDPMNPETDGDVTARLTGVRRVIDTRRSVPPAHDTRPSGRRWRTVAVLAAAAVLSPLAVVTLVPGIAARVGMPWVAILGSDVADRLACESGGHATQIPPREAPLRLWPGELPAGWTVQNVWAHEVDGPGGCWTPSLVVGATGADGVVTGTVQVIGPRADISMSGEPDLRPDRVAGRPAHEVVYPGMETAGFRRWVVRGPGDQEWEVRTNGFDGRRAREVVDQITLTATHASYQESPGSDVTVLHQRTGPPYPTTSHGYDWYVTFLDDQGHKRQLWVRDTSLDVPIVSEAVPGVRLYQLDGHPAMADVATAGPGDLAVEPSPGVLVVVSPRGDLKVAEQLLTSLVNLDRNDPRLTRYDLPEQPED